jgi:hypothetical protein
MPPYSYFSKVSRSSTVMLLAALTGEAGIDTVISGRAMASSDGGESFSEEAALAAHTSRPKRHAVRRPKRMGEAKGH